MKKSLIVFFMLMGSLCLTAQITNIEEKFALPTVLNESSGAIFFNGKLITHNDSGNENKLYELDTISGLVTRSVVITNANNTDWEDIAQDDTSIYIGDIGNNNGNRTDLKIYKINKNDYISSTNITAEIINFNYADQIDFTPSSNNTEWDAESLISFDESTLILMTKNWVNGTTKAYTIPKTIGTYTVNPLPTALESGGLITGATFNPLTQKIYLVGYSFILQPFIWVCENFTDNNIFSGTNTKTFISGFGLEQIEAVTYVSANRYFMTSESFNIPPFSDYGKLISFSTNDNVLSVAEQEAPIIKIFPNPVKDMFIIDSVKFASVEIYDSKAVLVHHGNHQNVNISKLNEGFYLVKINLKDGTYILKKIIKD